MFPLHSVLRGPKARARAPRRPTQRISRLGVEVLEDRRLLSVTPSLLADIAVDSSNPTWFAEANGAMLFAANDGTHGTELWKTDGTDAGTVLVKDISPGGASSNLKDLINVNGTVFFSDSNGIWKTDGTQAGTIFVKDTGGRPSDLTNVGGTLFFEQSRTLWKSDGTEEGTVPLKKFESPFPISSLTSTGGTLFFTAGVGFSGVELWKSDGTEEGTVQVKDIAASGGSNPSVLTNVNGTLFFNANDGTHGRELWKSDGTEEGTVLVEDIAPGTASSVSTSEYWPVNVSGTLYFAADDGTHGKELWKSDGTAEGTVQVKDINSGAGGSLHARFSPLGNVEGTVFFWANDGTHGYAVWKSDGTETGTVLVKDFPQGNDRSLLPLFSETFTSYDGEAFFSATDGTSGFELWKSDGTTQGTVLVKDISPGIYSGFRFGGGVNLNGVLLFPASDALHGTELWKSDGTEQGTVLVKDINPGTSAPSLPHNFTAVGNLTFFSAGFELWRTDGTEAGTFLVDDLLPGPGGADPQFLTNVNGVLYFTAWDAASWETIPFVYPPISLWKSDGTPEGTVRVKEIIPAGQDNDELGPRNLIEANGTLYFELDREDESRPGRTVQELWTSDGTEAGTGVFAVRGFDPMNVNGTVFFSWYNSVEGRELWKTDGTEAGTILVKDINPTGSSGPVPIANVNGTLFFGANDGVHGFELWKSDGTEAGTVPVKDINPGSSQSLRYTDGLFEPTVVDGKLYFLADDGTHGYELWKSDGTEAGTVLVKDVRPGSTESSPRQLTNVAGTLFFEADDGTHGREWWRSDGTQAGTFMLKDINPGPADGGDTRFTPLASVMAAVGNTFYFVANDGTRDALWMSDGTEAGTVPVDDGGLALSETIHLTNVNGILYFAADDGTHGSEPWMIAPDVVPRLFYNSSSFDDAASDGDANHAAMATDKLPYYAGSGKAAFENVSSFVHGINGITVDLADGHGPLTADDFTFKTGTKNAPDTWATGPAPTSISVLPGAGVAGMDRVRIVWPDGAIKNTWLQVLVKGDDAAGGFNTNTGLEASTIFYFGSRVGDTGNDSSPPVFLTTGADMIGVRANQGPVHSLTSRYDFNRDFVIDAADEIIARKNAGFLIRLDIPQGAAEVLIATDDGAASAVAAALTAPHADWKSEVQTDVLLVAHPLSPATARPANESPRAALFETAPAPARSIARDPASIDLALDAELLDSLLPEPAEGFGGW